ncbi:hypothetical protein BGZ51_009622 [Haplosporangium sp. Z 767]|nr:hypothetical protein BGZ51_009622 [Haplosporangium sp. Z 767]
MDVYTDASDSDWGIVIGQQTWNGTWKDTERSQHIDWKELQTVYYAVTLPQVQGRVVNLICDNTATIAYVNKFGGTKCTIQTTTGTAGMEHRSSILPASREDLGSSSSEPIRLSIEPSGADLHDMEATPTSASMGCNATLVEETGQSLRVPSMEPHSRDSSETETGATPGNPDHSVLAVRNMVSNSAGNGSNSTNASSSISSPPSTRKRTSYLGQKHQLEPLSLETKRQTLMAEGLTPGVASFILSDRSVIRTQARYRSTQQVFLEWLKAGAFEQDINPAIPIINWLHHIMATQKLAWSTILVKKTAVLALFSSADDIKSDPSFQSFLRAGSSSVVVDTKHEDYDISRVVEPDGIYCTDVARSRVIRDQLELAVVLPKEKRGRQRIIKYVHISRHPDPAICPVQTYLAYRSRTLAMDLPTPHPKDPLCKITPLIRYLKDQHKPVVATTISVFMNSISRKMVPEGKKPPKLRALGSTLAALAGVPVADIMVQGNWSSPKIFEKHYRLSSSTANNLSISTLGSL